MRLISKSYWSNTAFSLPLPGHSSSADVSPSPSAEASGLLSLPWEMVTHIASHLPAQCVITVLPKVSFKVVLAHDFHKIPLKMSYHLIFLLICVASI